MHWSRIAIAFWLIYAALAFGLRSYVQFRRTGSFGFRLSSPKLHERLTAGFVSIAMMLFSFVPFAALFGWLNPLPFLDDERLKWAGLFICTIGTIATLWAQFAMGDSWRVGVDTRERTTLVTGGPFAIVRNPIFSAIFVFAFGGILLLPYALSIGAFVALVLSLDLHVRFVEEPYLIGVHGDTYRAWAARVGRFVPYFGRL